MNVDLDVDEVIHGRLLRLDEVAADGGVMLAALDGLERSRGGGT